MLFFGGKILVNNGIGWVINYANTFFIGHFLGIKTLGQFNRNLTLVSLPMEMVTTSFQGVLFSFYSKINANKDNLRQKYLGNLDSLAVWYTTSPNDRMRVYYRPMKYQNSNKMYLHLK